MLLIRISKCWYRTRFNPWLGST